MAVGDDLPLLPADATPRNRRSRSSNASTRSNQPGTVR